MELLAILVAVLGGGFVLAWGTRRRSSWIAGAGAAALLAGFATFAGTMTGYRQPFAATAPQPPANRPIEVRDEGYVSSQACRSCHPHEYDAWHGSYHRTMTQVVNPDTIVAPFDDVELEVRGRKYRLSRRDGGFWVEMDDPDWKGARGRAPRVERPVVLATGSHHYQAYWFPAGDSRALSFFEFAYRIPEQRWLPIHAIFLTPPDVSQQAESLRWNTQCNRCHATRSRPRISGRDSMDTYVAELGIACEACHGPAGEHVAANRDPRRRYAHHLSDRADPTIVNPATLDTRRSSEVCGQCHSVNRFQDDADALRFLTDGFRYRPGDVLGETREIMSEGESRFWSDGMVRIAGREYNGLIDSPCFRHGDESRGVLSCISCHRMHRRPDDERPLAEWADDQLDRKMDSNQACLQCHTSYEGVEALTAHTRHDAGSSGSLCYNCHMPHTSLGLLKAMRSHTIDSPDVEVSVATGRPNACNLCHLDRTLAWTGERLSEWYDAEPPELSPDESEIAASILWLLKGDAGQRSVVAWSMGWRPAHQASGTDWLAPYLGQLLVDPYAAVRFQAARSLRTLNGYDSLDYDYVGPASDRLRVARSTMNGWRFAPAPGSRETAPLLIDAGGGLRWNEFGRLLSRRDDRRVHLAE